MATVTSVQKPEEVQPLEETGPALTPLVLGRPAPELESDRGPRYLGVPTSKSRVDNADLVAALASFACLAAGIAIIHPGLPYAAKLGTSNQIVGLGFLLGIINQCLPRVSPFLFILLEARSGHPRLQNLAGLLNLSPLASQLAWKWKTLLTLLAALPLVLSVSYKQFGGGIAKTKAETTMSEFAPAAPPGFQSWLMRYSMVEDFGSPIPRFNAVLVNFTAPFLDTAGDLANIPPAMPPYTSSTMRTGASLRMQAWLLTTSPYRGTVRGYSLPRCQH